MIESSASEVRDAYNDLARATHRYLSSENLPAGTERCETLRAQANEVGRLALEIEQRARDHLEDLDKPAEVPRRRRLHRPPEP